MAPQEHNGMQCNEFDALLADAIDKMLTGPKAEAFLAHGKTCPLCGPLLAEAEIGKHWLKQLVEVEPPAMLMHNILASTIGIDTARLASAAPVRATWLEQMIERARMLITPVFGVVRQPRFAMS